MFDNFGTAIVQAIGFFGVFGFFVYQLLLDGKKTTQTKSKPAIKKVDEKNVLKDKPKKKGIFGRKEKATEVIEKPKKKGWF